ncbi:hypothetical protein [Rhizobium sp. NFR07]|uniref:hypothetical protein n=1 Tax=Rhizobium sp. NFR07 TaxID=1566262 RepID=UPI000B869CBA|nr:hypothetical protein [Rhizobium sp. NFR07]
MTSSFQWTNLKIRARIADPFVIIGRMACDEGRVDAFTMALAHRGRLAASGHGQMLAQRREPCKRPPRSPLGWKGDCKLKGETLASGQFRK